MFVDWDPIDVSSLDCNYDEFVRYARKIVNMLFEGRDSFAVSCYLIELESGWLSHPADEKGVEKVVKKIFGNFKLTN